MSGQPDSSDDLIAELAKLMATNAKPEPAPAPVPRPAATVKPIRIPGSDQPVQAEARQPEPRQPEARQPEQRQPDAPRPSAPVVRIPGMEMPVPSGSVPAPPAQPFEPRIVAETPRPAEPRDQMPVAPALAPVFSPVQPSISPAPDPIAAIIAAELEHAAPIAEEPPAQPAPRPVPVAPVSTRFNAAPRPTQPAPAPRPMPQPSQPRVQPTTPINLKPIANDRARIDDTDSFGISPVTGVTPRARANSDPIAEIESLIGEAVRVDLDRPAPVVTPVTIPTPRRTQPIEPKAETAPRSADEAILAAAAATGRPVDVLDDMSAPPRPAPVTEPEGLVLPPSRPRPSSLRQYVGMAVAGTLLLAAGFGLYWVLGMGRDNGTVPVLTADSSPVKVAPAPADASTEPRSPVLDELDGVTTDANAETIVSTDESTDTDVAAAAPDDVSESGLANRKVRTVTVRPDGTIVSDDDAIAGSEQLAANRPNVPDVPSDASAATEVLATAAAGVEAADPIGVAIANPDATPTTTEMALVDPGTTADTAGDPNAPIPMPPLLGRATQPMVTDAAPLSSVNAVTDPVPTATTTDGQPLNLLSPDNVAPPPPSPSTTTTTTTASTANTTGAVPVTAANTAAAYVQLSAQRDQETALADARRFTQRFANVIGDIPLEVHIVDLGAKGTWYRVLLPASSGTDANIACASIKAAGGDCLVR